MISETSFTHRIRLALDYYFSDYSVVRNKRFLTRKLQIERVVNGLELFCTQRGILLGMHIDNIYVQHIEVMLGTHKYNIAYIYLEVMKGIHIDDIV